MVTRRSGVLSRDGSHLAVAAPHYDVNYENLAESGQVRIFQLRANKLELMGDPIFGENGRDRAGHSVALSYSGDTVAIGAPGHEGSAGESSGHVRVYLYEEFKWVQKGSDIDGEAAWDWSGGSVSLSDDGSVIAIGAENSHDASGHVRVFHFVNDEWYQLGSDIIGEAEEEGEFGSLTSLSSDGKTVAAGAWAYVRIFSFNESIRDWVQLGKDIEGKIGALSLTTSGRRIAVSAPTALTGYVLVYDYVMGEWRQVGGNWQVKYLVRCLAQAFQSLLTGPDLLWVPVQ